MSTLIKLWRWCARCGKRTEHLSAVSVMADGRQVEEIRCTCCGEVRVYDVA